MKRILMLTTGGTIASEESEEGLVPKTTGQQMLDMIPELAELCEIDCENILNLDSTNIQPEEWAVMARAAFKGMQDYDGIVITHGTDTMAYSAAALSTMLIDPGVPVVLTGSQLPIGEQGTDAVRNIRDAFLTALGAPAGVYLTFGGRVIDGLYATKARTAGFDAFISVNRPYVGKITDGKLMLNVSGDRTVQREPELDDRFDTKVLLFKLIPGFDPALLQAALDLGYKGVVIESFGPGGLTYYRRDLLPAVEKLISAGVIVAITTQCIYDGCDMTHYAVGIKALKTGVIPAGDLTTEALVVKMMAALGRWQDREIIDTFLRGEIDPIDRTIPLT